MWGWSKTNLLKMILAVKRGMSKAGKSLPPPGPVITLFEYQASVFMKIKPTLFSFCYRMFPKRWDGSFPECGSHVWNGLIENMAPMTCSHSPEQLKVSVLKSEKGEYRKGDTCLHWHAWGTDLHGQAPLPPPTPVDSSTAGVPSCSCSLVWSCFSEERHGALSPGLQGAHHQA